jgi:hypothetical protein
MYRALVNRGRESLVVIALSALISGVIAATPWYLSDRAQRVASSDLRAAPVSQSVVNADRPTVAGEQIDAALTDAEREAAAALPLPDTRLVSGLQADALASTPQRPPGTARLNTQVILRSGVCEELVFDGRCPQGASEVALSAAMATELGLRAGDTVLIGQSGADADVKFTIAGVYRIRSADSRYWAGRYASPAQRSRLIFVTSPAAFATAGARQPRVVADLVPADDLFDRHSVSDVLDVFDRAPLQSGKLDYKTPLRDLAARVLARQLALLEGMAIVAGEVLLFGWVLLFLVLRQLGWQHRLDLGTLKLRGVGATRSTAITVGRHAVCLFLGGAIGVLAAATLARFDPVAVLEAVAAVVVVVVGSLIAAILAERRTYRADVTHLLRTVPRPQGGLVLLGLEASAVLATVAAVFLARDKGGVLAAVLPILLAAAVALALAEGMALVLSRMGIRLLRSGSLPAGMAAHWHARRPALLRANALLAIAVAMAGQATATAAVADQATRERAFRALGAQHVLTVQASTNAQLLAAVRQADPSAVAVVRDPDTHVVAVDTARLDRAVWPDTAALRPRAAVDLPLLPSPDISLDVRRFDTLAVPLWIHFELADAGGRPVRAAAGPVKIGPNTLQVNLPACAAGCRLRSIGLRSGPGESSANSPAGVDVVLSRLTSDAPLTERIRWRTAIRSAPAVPLNVAAGRDGLRLSIPDGLVVPYVYPDVGIDRLPVLAGGGWVGADADAMLDVFPLVPARIRTVGRLDSVPGAVERAVLTDLELADRFGAGVSGAEVQEVWLDRDVPAGFVAKLRELGVEVLDERSAAAAVARLGDQVAPTVAGYRLVSWWLAVLASAVALLVLILGERPELAATLRALRHQGFSRRQARRTVALNYLAVVATSLLTGVLAFLVTRPPVAPALAVFDDNWKPLHGFDPLPAAALALLAAALLLGLVCLVVGRRLMREVRA